MLRLFPPRCVWMCIVRPHCQSNYLQMAAVCLRIWKQRRFFELDGQFWPQLKCAHCKTAKNANALSTTVCTDMHHQPTLAVQLTKDGNALPPYMKTNKVFWSGWPVLASIKMRPSKNDQKCWDFVHHSVYSKASAIPIGSPTSARWQRYASVYENE